MVPASIVILIAFVGFVSLAYTVWGSFRQRIASLEKRVEALEKPD